MEGWTFAATDDIRSMYFRAKEREVTRVQLFALKIAVQINNVDLLDGVTNSRFEETGSGYHFTPYGRDLFGVKLTASQ